MPITLVVLHGGVSVDWDVVLALLSLEDRGATFRVAHDCADTPKIHVTPNGLLTPSLRAFLTTHRDEVLRILSYNPHTDL